MKQKKKCGHIGTSTSLDKIKDDSAAVLFYTGFPSYEALISFYNYIKPKLSKMQYWKGKNLVKESQPYQVDDKKYKPGPSRKEGSFKEALLSGWVLTGTYETQGWSLCPRPRRQIW